MSDLGIAGHSSYTYIYALDTKDISFMGKRLKTIQYFSENYLITRFNVIYFSFEQGPRLKFIEFFEKYFKIKKISIIIS